MGFFFWIKSLFSAVKKAGEPEIRVQDTLDKKAELGIPLNYGEAREIVERRIQQNKDTRAAHERKEFPIHYTKDTTPEEMQGKRDFMQYAMTLIQEEQPLYHRILAARMSGLSIKRIARELTKRLGREISIAQVSAKEKEAVEYVKDKIEHLRRTGIPIFEKSAS